MWCLFSSGLQAAMQKRQLGENFMEIITFLPVLEMLIINIGTMNKCCRRKYSSFWMGMFLFVFSAGFFLICIFGERYLWEGLFSGDGSFFLLGFLYLIPYSFLCEEKTFRLFVIMCMCWSYTMGAMALSIQIVGLLEVQNRYIWIFGVQSLIFLVTLLPFYKTVVPKYIFVLRNIEIFGRRWYKYLVLSSSLSFFSLAMVNHVLQFEESSISKVAALLVLLASIYVVYFILYGIVRDSIEMNHLEYAALHDSLTGLGNRAQLLVHLNELLGAEQVFSVLFLDLDRFKQINDQYGHAVGDRYLIHFARLCTQILENRGRIYRYGGDEFVILYYGVVSQAEVERLKECRGWDFGAPCPFNQVSVGVLVCSPPCEDAEQILKKADRIMYQDKVQKEYQKDRQERG